MLWVLRDEVFPNSFSEGVEAQKNPLFFFQKVGKLMDIFLMHV